MDCVTVRKLRAKSAKVWRLVEAGEKIGTRRLPTWNMLCAPRSTPKSRQCGARGLRQSGRVLLLLNQRVTNLVVVDTNVLVSALFKPASMPARVVDGLRRNLLVPVVCAEVMGG